MNDSEPRLRIALVIEDVGMGGGQERVLAELAPRLALRHDVHLFSFSVRDLDLSAITVHRLADPHLPLGLRALWFAAASSVAIRPGQFDVVLSQGGNTLVQNAVFAHTAHRARKRLRDEVHRRYGGPRGLSRLWFPLRDAAFAGLERRAALRCRGRIIAISRSVRDYFISEYGLQADEVHVARNGVDHAIFRPEVAEEARPRVRAELGLREDEFVALFMGGLWYEKCLPEIVEAIGGTESRTRLVIVGSGDADELLARVDADCDHERFVFVPHVDRPQDYFAMADCLVHPFAVEPFGLVVLEAAACGIPLLAGRTGAALDLVEDGVSGFFVSTDPADIAARIDQLAADPALAARMGEEAHRRSLHFTWDRQAEEIEALLLRFAEEGGGAG